MKVPKTHLMQNCGEYRCEPRRGMSLIELSAVVSDMALNLRELREIIRELGASNALLDDITSGSNDFRRVADELLRIAGDSRFSEMDLPDRVTGCVCPASGFCERHQVDKTCHWHTLCRTKPGMFQLWEEGHGPGQLPITKTRKE